MIERVLIVEDDPITRDLLGDACREAGFAVESVAEGESALSAARRERPSVVVLDLHLPGLSGIEVLRRLASEPSLTTVPVVIVSARLEPRLVQACTALGAYQALGKPVAPDVLTRTLRGAMGRVER